MAEEVDTTKLEQSGSLASPAKPDPDKPDPRLESTVQEADHPDPRLWSVLEKAEKRTNRS